MKKIVTCLFAFVLIMVFNVYAVDDFIQAEADLLKLTGTLALQTDLSQDEQFLIMRAIADITEDYRKIVEHAKVNNQELLSNLNLEANLNKLSSLINSNSMINDVLKLFSTITNDIFSILPNLNGSIHGIINPLFNHIRNFINKFQDVVKIDGIPEIAKYIDAVKQLRQVSNSLDKIDLNPSQYLDILQWVEQIVDQLEVGLSEINSVDPEAISMKNWIEATRDLITQLKQDLLADQSKIVSGGGNIITGTLKTIPNVMIDAVRNIINTLISSMTNMVFSTINSLVTSVFQGINTTINQIVNGILTSIESMVLGIIPKSGYSAGMGFIE
jgi:phage-related protein